MFHSGLTIRHVQTLKSRSISIQLNRPGARVVRSQLGLDLFYREKSKLTADFRGNFGTISTQLGLEPFSRGRPRLAVSIEINCCGTRIVNIRLGLDCVPKEKTRLVSILLNPSGAGIVHIWLRLGLVPTKKSRLHSILLNGRGTCRVNVPLVFDLASGEGPELASIRPDVRETRTVSARLSLDLVFRGMPRLAKSCLGLRGNCTVSTRLVRVLISRERIGILLHVVFAGRLSLEDLVLRGSQNPLEAGGCHSRCFACTPRYFHRV